jgi:hypothetical protein
MSMFLGTLGSSVVGFDEGVSSLTSTMSPSGDGRVARTVYVNVDVKKKRKKDQAKNVKAETSKRKEISFYRCLLPTLAP